MVGYVLGCSLAEAVARVVGLGEALGRIVGTTPLPGQGLETDLASRFRSSHRGHGWSLHCCSGYCYWHTFLEAEIEVEQCLGGGGKVDLEGVGGPTAQPLHTLVLNAVVGCVAGCSLAEAVARVVGFEEARCRVALLQDIDNGLTRECRGLEPKEGSVGGAWVLYE